MYTLELGDYKYIFEYDTIQELKEQLEITKATHKEILEAEEKYKKVNKIVAEQKKVELQGYTTFANLELKFVSNLKEELEETGAKLSNSSFKAYANTFNKLKAFFESCDIKNMNEARFKAFRSYLKNDLKLNAKTVNIQMIYLSKFLDFGVKQKILDTNESKNIKQYVEKDLKKENFSKEDFENIKNYNYDKYYQNIFEILKHSGMRISELYNLKNEDIKKDENNIYYFQINDAKTDNGNREIPIHKTILDMVLSLNFPISNKTSNAFNKEVLKQLYLVIDKNSTKSLHTFRANFVSKCINNYHDSIELIQCITGHSMGDSKNLTIKTYAKNFDLALKQKVIDSITY